MSHSVSHSVSHFQSVVLSVNRSVSWSSRLRYSVGSGLEVFDYHVHCSRSRSPILTPNAVQIVVIEADNVLFTSALHVEEIRRRRWLKRRSSRRELLRNRLRITQFRAAALARAQAACHERTKPSSKTQMMLIELWSIDVHTRTMS